MVAFLHNTTIVKSHMYGEVGGLFQVFFDSDVVVPVWQINLSPIPPSSN